MGMMNVQSGTHVQLFPLSLSLSHLVVCSLMLGLLGLE